MTPADRPTDARREALVKILEASEGPMTDALSAAVTGSRHPFVLMEQLADALLSASPAVPREGEPCTDCRKRPHVTKTENGDELCVECIIARYERIVRAAPVLVGGTREATDEKFRDVVYRIVADAHDGSEWRINSFGPFFDERKAEQCAIGLRVSDAPTFTNHRVVPMFRAALPVREGPSEDLRQKIEAIPHVAYIDLEDGALTEHDGRYPAILLRDVLAALGGSDNGR